MLALGPVLVQKLEELGCSVFVESVRELGNSRRDLETLRQNDLLALKANVFGPLDETSEVGLGADILANTEVFGLRLEQRVLRGLLSFASGAGGGGDLLSGFGGLVIEARGRSLAMHFQQSDKRLSEL